MRFPGGCHVALSTDPTAKGDQTQEDCVNRWTKTIGTGLALGLCMLLGASSHVAAETPKASPATTASPAKAGATPPALKPAAVVKYRENVMKVMANHMSAISAVVKGDVPYSDQLVLHAAGIQALSPTLVHLFPAGTGPDKVKSESKAAVWKDWDTFKASSTRMNTESDKLLQVAKAGDLAAFNVQFAAVGKACANCHDTFRIKD